MFRTIKALVGELHGINLRLKDLIALQESQGPADERLEALELSRSVWEAEIEGILLKADGHQKAARSAESRTRTMVRHHEDLADPIFGDREEVEAPVPERYVPASEEEGMPDVRLDVATNNKARALNAKFQ